jgi:hypothetical protein
MGVVMISVETKGNFNRLENFLSSVTAKLSIDSFYAMLASYGAAGVTALASATPRDTGRSSVSWTYNITNMFGSYELSWMNDDLDSQGTPIVVLIEYGHGTGSGGYVSPRGFINPAVQPIVDQLTNDLWSEVTSA